MALSLAGRVALVTGAGRGIGRVVAAALAREGVRVTLVSRTIAEVEDAAAAIRADGGEALALRADVSSERDVEWLARELERETDALHVLVNNAALRMDHIGAGAHGYPYRMPLVDVAVADWDRMMGVNLRGPFLTCKLLAPLLFRAHGASVINVSGGAGVRGQAGRAPYSASKFGLEGLTQALAAEWREANVAVNSLEPGGSVLTDPVKTGLVARDPSARFLRADVVAGPALFLARQDASGVTGTHLNALAWHEERGDGGFEAWRASGR